MFLDFSCRIGQETILLGDDFGWIYIDTICVVVDVVAHHSRGWLRRHGWLHVGWSHHSRLLGLWIHVCSTTTTTILLLLVLLLGWLLRWHYHSGCTTSSRGHGSSRLVLTLLLSGGWLRSLRRIDIGWWQRSNTGSQSSSIGLLLCYLWLYLLWVLSSPSSTTTTTIDIRHSRCRRLSLTHQGGSLRKGHSSHIDYWSLLWWRLFLLLLLLL